jgi:hypothetical protein
MKCPECGYDQKVKYGLKCGGCGYEFLFNPKESKTRGMTDGKFLACLQLASQNGTMCFTENQLYAAFCRKLTPSNWPVRLLGLVLVAIGGIFAFEGSKTAGLFMLLFGAILVAATFGKTVAKQTVGRSRFQDSLSHWRAAGRPIERLIEHPSLHEPPPEWSESDIYDYGVERILIVERDILVDLLVKNGVHAEQRMLVLAESGYPAYLQPLARRLLQERPDLPLFLLHDATTHGADMEKRVLAGGMLPIDEHPITDLGMIPADFQKLKRTKLFDPENKERALPVDAMMLPFLTLGLGAAMTEGMAFSTMLERQHQGSVHDGGFGYGSFDFG